MKKLLILPILSLLVSSTSRADTFDDITSKIVDNAPDYVKALNIAKVDSVGALSAGNLADPEVEWEYLIGKGVENRWSLGVNQSFDWPGVYSARRRSAGTSALVPLLEAETVKADLKMQTRQALVEYVNACLNLAALTESDSSLTRVERLVIKDNNRQMTRLDLNKIKVERGLLQAKILVWEDTRDNAVATLQEINPGVDVRKLLTTLPESYPADALLPSATYCYNSKFDISVIARKMTVVAAENAVKTTSLERYPGFSLGYRHAYEDGVHFNGFAVGLTLPVFSNRHKMAAARTQVLTAKTDASLLEAELSTKIGELHHRAERLQKAVMSLSPTFEVYDNIALLERAYTGGEITLIDYLSESKYFIDSRLEYLDLLFKYHSVLAQLSRYTTPVVRGVY